MFGRLECKKMVGERVEKKPRKMMEKKVQTRRSSIRGLNETKIK